MLPSAGDIVGFTAKQPWGPWTPLSSEIWSPSDNDVTQMRSPSGAYGMYIIESTWDAEKAIASLDIIVSFNGIGQPGPFFYGTYVLRVELTCTG